MGLRWLEVHYPCECTMNVNVNALVARARCDRCGKERDLSSSWHTLDVIGADSADLPLVLESDDAQHAHCRLCKRALDEALFHGTAARRHVACACGARVTMRPSPEGVVPRWTRGVVIGEDEDRVDEVAHAKTGAAVILDCASCGASLRFDAAGHAKCGYCATEGVIDDDLWRRLHGTRPRKRFYYWEDPAEVLRLEADEKARDRAELIDHFRRGDLRKLARTELEARQQGILLTLLCGMGLVAFAPFTVPAFFGVSAAHLMLARWGMGLLGAALVLTALYLRVTSARRRARLDACEVVIADRDEDAYVFAIGDKTFRVTVRTHGGPMCWGVMDALFLAVDRDDPSTVLLFSGGAR